MNDRLTIDELTRLAIRNDAESQMTHREYECLISLIDEKMITTKAELSEYIDIWEETK
jgi:DNA-binding response OmpR family regulator